jgi:6-phosphogluconolactonase
MEKRLITRRKVLAGMVAAPFVAESLWTAGATADAGVLLFVGTGTATGSKGIYAYRFDPANGALSPPALAAEAPSPSFLALSPDRRTLFAVNEVDSYKGVQSNEKTGAVSAYALDPGSGRLTLINTVASGGAGPCHLTTDHTGRVLVVANYTGGSAASFQIAADGRLSEAVSVFRYQSPGPGPGQDKDRQEASHAHRATVSPDNGFVLINDLGLDRIHIYHLDAATAKLTPGDPPEWQAAPGSGPRALRFHPNGRWAYCVNELSSTVSQLAWDPHSGTLALLATTELLPAGHKGATRASEIVFDDQGGFAYVANRDDDFLVSFAVETASGKLTAPHRSPCGGKIPRHIALDPTQRWILVANQDSNLISVFKRSTKTGQLASNGQSFPIQSPQCLLFA